jgi:hypothetical protein
MSAGRSRPSIRPSGPITTRATAVVDPTRSGLRVQLHSPVDRHHH